MQWMECKIQTKQFGRAEKARRIRAYDSIQEFGS
jgi:hypothetical protein